MKNIISKTYIRKSERRVRMTLRANGSTTTNFGKRREHKDNTKVKKETENHFCLSEDPYGVY